MSVHWVTHRFTQVFEEFAEKTDAISLTEPGITTALEFKDGKIMLGNIWQVSRKSTTIKSSRPPVKDPFLICFQNATWSPS